MDTNETIDGILEHYGIRGMRWGVRRGDNAAGGGGHGVETAVKVAKGAGKAAKATGKATEHVLKTVTAPHNTSPDAIKTHNSAVRAKKHGLKALSNQELKDLNYRINLEQNFHKMVPKEQGRIKRGRDTMEKMMWQAGEQQLQPYINMAAGKGLKKILGSVV